jgi:hypothetical protein
MTLTAAIAVCMAVTASLAYSAWRFPARFPRAATFVAVAVPLGLVAALLRGHDRSRAGQSFQVVGQYAFLLDTLRIGAGTGADVRIPAPSGSRLGSGLVAVHFTPNDSLLIVRAEPGAPPVVVGDRMLAAAPVGRSASVTVARAGAAPVAVRVAMPWWPLGCAVNASSAPRGSAFAPA